MIVHPHNYSNYKETRRENPRIEVRGEVTSDGVQIAHVVRLEESYGLWGNQPERCERRRGTVETEIAQFPTNSLGRIKLEERAIRSLQSKGKYNPNIPLKVISQQSHEKSRSPLYL